MRVLACVLLIAGVACGGPAPGPTPSAQTPKASSIAPSAAPPAVPPASAPGAAGDEPAPHPVSPPPEWPPQCAQSIRDAVDELAARGFAFEYTDIVACPTGPRPSSHPHYVEGACSDRAVSASFQAPKNPEHIYMTIEELEPEAVPAIPRGMARAREQASTRWVVTDEPDRRRLVRKSDQLVVLIRLLYDDEPSEAAASFLFALRVAADECLGDAS